MHNLLFSGEIVPDNVPGKEPRDENRRFCSTAKRIAMPKKCLSVNLFPVKERGSPCEMEPTSVGRL